ncbi:unnamed protein product [Heterobilharzia americana]|nr:unnamed protein product [Heterobilharzia americana]
MFASSYDGCDSDSSSSSDTHNEVGYASIIESSKAKAIEFDELMNKELNAVVKQIHHNQPDCETGNKLKKNLRVRFLKEEDDYANDEDNFPVDKDPLCDYDEDEANSKWVQENLPGGHCKKSDAILNCPGCISVLSLNCYRHPNFKTRYYTEYPINCFADETQVISRTMSKPHRKSKSNAETDSESNRTTLKEYHPVTCKVCGNSVGFKEIKTNMVYLDNVLASHS